jgi:branched-chain amino acid transport system substrate-binding protein
MGWRPSLRAEGRIYANYIQAFYPGRKIVVLWQNDQFGRDLYRGLVDALGDLARTIIVDIAYDMSDAYLDTHISILKRSGAEIFVLPAYRPLPPERSRSRQISTGIPC